MSKPEVLKHLSLAYAQASPEVREHLSRAIQALDDDTTKTPAGGISLAPARELFKAARQRLERARGETREGGGQ